MVKDPIEARTDAAQQVGRGNRSAEEDVRKALPGVTDPAVDLDRGFANLLRGTTAVRLRRRRRLQRLVGVE